jgi:hypothetical protein
MEGLSDFAGVEAALSSTTAGALLTFGPDSMLLQGRSVESLGAGDFIV